MKNYCIVLLYAFFAGIMVGIHRRVIWAAIRGKEIPQAPASHFWVKNHK